MRRLTDEDKQLGKYITYGDSCGNSIRMVYSTDVDEDEPAESNNTFTVTAFGKVVRITLPALIKPIKVKIEATTWDAATVARIGRNYYYEYFNRDYGFSISDDFFQLFYGGQDSGGFNFPANVKVKRWSAFIPWKDSRLVKNQVFDGNGALVWEEDFSRTESAKINNQRRHEVESSMYKRSFLVRDSDGEEIVVDVHKRHMEWKRGTKWCKWMSLFVKDIKRTSVELSFRKEIGAKKGTWKGGLFGVGGDIQPNEDLYQAVERFFAERFDNDRDLKGVTFLRQVE